MKITKDEVLYVANLARLDLDDTSIDKFSEQIGDILDYVDILEKVDTKDVPLTSHAISLNNAFREDVVVESKGTDSAMLNAPKEEDGYFVVPKVIG